MLSYTDWIVNLDSFLSFKGKGPSSEYERIEPEGDGIMNEDESFSLSSSSLSTILFFGADNCGSYVFLRTIDG